MGESKYFTPTDSHPHTHTCPHSHTNTHIHKHTHTHLAALPADHHPAEGGGQSPRVAPQHDSPLVRHFLVKYLTYVLKRNMCTFNTGGCIFCLIHQPCLQNAVMMVCWTLSLGFSNSAHHTHKLAREPCQINFFSVCACVLCMWLSACACVSIHAGT